MSTSIFPHQHQVYRALLETARAFFAAEWRDLPVRPRFSRLIVGPSGAGKSRVVAALAEELEMPLFQVVATNWIPLGCTDRGARPTWPDLIEFSQTHLRGIILVDEVDKLMGWSPWIQYIRCEAFSLLDGRVPDNVVIPSPEEGDEDPELLEKRLEFARTSFGNRFLIVAAGAFQDLWQEKQIGRIGFGSESSGDAEILQKIDLARVIPTEIVYRFASPILILPPLKENDYWAILEGVLPQLDGAFKRRVRKIAKSSILLAVKNQTGCRKMVSVTRSTST
jgi:hypothetical protein